MTKNLFIILCVLTFGIFTTSCNQCIGPLGKEKIVCDNGGTCNDGECDCLKGYTGTNCEIFDLCELNDVECIFGACDEGLCYCEEGYEGKKCETETRAQFLGEYNVVEACVPLDTFNDVIITIERDFLNGNSIEIYDIFNAERFSVAGFFSKVSANVQEGTSSFNIYNQTPDDNEKTIIGTGMLDYSDTAFVRIEVDYTVERGNKTYDCTITGVKVE